MATYFAELAAGATIFTGFTTHANSNCSTPTAGTANRTTVAPPVAPIKGKLGVGTVHSCSSSFKMKLTINTSGTWYAGWSFAKVTPYTQAMKINGVSATANFKKANGDKFWIDAYNSAGTLTGSAFMGSQTAGTVTGSVALNTTAFVTVPKSGYLVLRIGYLPSTNKGSGKGEIKSGQTAATSGLKFITTEVPAITGPAATIAVTDGNDSAAATAHVGKIQALATFQDSAATAIPNGVMVTAYLATDYATGNSSPLASAAIAGGAGAVVIDVPTTSDVILVCDPLDAGMGVEVAMTKAITPTVI